MKEIARNIGAVGKLDEFGLDITIMLDDGTVYETEKY
jgi:hypothetical protein